MAKKGKGPLAKLLSFVLVLVGLMIGLAIGGGFISGLFTGGLILDQLPLLAHKITGWIIVGSLALTALMAVWDFAKKVL